MVEAPKPKRHVRILDEPERSLAKMFTEVSDDEFDAAFEKFECRRCGQRIVRAPDVVDDDESAAELAAYNDMQDWKNFTCARCLRVN